MLTPRFSVTQDAEALTITIHAPFTNVADTEVFMEDREFRFFSRPYFLRLHLPGGVVEDDGARAAYDAASNSFVVRAPKAEPGQDFRGLDMLTNLLAPPRVPEGPADIQEISLGGEDGAEWFFEQSMPPEEEAVQDAAVDDECGYGFGFTRRGVYNKNEEAREILDLKEPDVTTWSRRRQLRLDKEKEDFSDDHYLCDLFEDVEIQRLLQLPSRWSRMGGTLADPSFSPDEQERLISLPQEFPSVRKEHRQSVFFGLVDILCASCYDYRCSEGERSPESGWTVSKLSASLSCCEKYDSLPDCVVACVRRSLCYPLFRHYSLSLKCLRDVVELLKGGNVTVVKALVELIPLFVESDRYLLNQLYVEPYASWAQRIPSGHFEELAMALENVINDLEKKQVGLELVEIEHAAKLVHEEEVDAKGVQSSNNPFADISASLNKLKLEEKSLPSSDSDDDSDSETDSDSCVTSNDDGTSSSEDVEKKEPI